ncbi:hypothetical protein [Chryseobacterium daeguense]|uniref:hypothetical protein n=1 Tax=Chryseobacterium daeguense TaxID=412438 RepID=UPI0003FE5906|nr:hypothetical protein [Chryseobacterium daeguense]
MEKFIIRDYYIQTGLTIAFFIALFLDMVVFQKGICIVVYFLLAINHIISSNVKFFSKQYVKSNLFKIYYFISMVFMISFIAMLIPGNSRFSNEYLHEFWSSILCFGLFGTPVLAIIYYLICDNDYDKLNELKKQNNENT